MDASPAGVSFAALRKQWPRLGSARYRPGRRGDDLGADEPADAYPQFQLAGSRILVRCRLLLEAPGHVLKISHVASDQFRRLWR